MNPDRWQRVEMVCQQALARAPEARAVSALNHPNICTLYDIGRLRAEGASAGRGDAVGGSS